MEQLTPEVISELAKAIAVAGKAIGAGLAMGIGAIVLVSVKVTLVHMLWMLSQDNLS